MKHYSFEPLDKNKYWNMHLNLGIPLRGNLYNDSWRRYSKNIDTKSFRPWSPGGRNVDSYNNYDVYIVDGNLRHLSSKFDSEIEYQMSDDIDNINFPEKLLNNYPMAVLSLSGLRSELELRVSPDSKQELHIKLDDKEFASSSFIHINLGENSEVSIVWHLGSVESSFSLPFIVMNLEPNAKLENSFLYNVDSTSSNFSTIFYNLKEGSSVYNHNSVNSSGLFRKDMFTYIDGKECNFDDESISLFSSGFGEIVNHIEHSQPASRSVQNVRTIAHGNGVGSWQGMAKVYENCEGTDAEQNHKGLILSPDAKIHMKPQLEIFTDDVVCGHGASLGKLDEESIQYMMSRGIKKELARKMLVEAFINSSFSGVDVSMFVELSVRENIETILKLIEE